MSVAWRKGAALRWPFRIPGVPLLMEKRNKFRRATRLIIILIVLYTVCLFRLIPSAVRFVPPRYFHLSIPLRRVTQQITVRYTVELFYGRQRPF